jgi:scytalone dehydratase
MAVALPGRARLDGINYGGNPGGLRQAKSPTTDFNMFDIYVPEALQFQDYLQICQVARTWADGYDRKVGHTLDSKTPRLCILIHM